MEYSIKQLKEENERLAELVLRDSLTGLYNRRAMEKEIGSILKQGQQCILLVLDANSFKSINDRFGHLAGDEALKLIAAVLQRVFRANDLIGRIGGDEFLICMHGSLPDGIDERMNNVNDQLKQMRIQNRSTCLGVSYGYSISMKSDDFETLFDRADRKMLKQKAQWHEQAADFSVAELSEIEILRDQTTHHMDIRQITNELEEQDSEFGAYRVDYERFQCLYRFVEREMLRSGRETHMLLIRVVRRRADCSSISVPDDLKNQVEQLGQIISTALRLGDVYTSYDNCHYLIMLIGADWINSGKVWDRIRSRFYQKMEMEGEPDICLEQELYPLKPVK